MTSSGVVARRLVLSAGEVAELCARLALLAPPGFAAAPSGVTTEGLLVGGDVHPSVAAGLAATCSPQVAVLLTSTIGDVHAAAGVRGDLGGSMVRAGDSAVEVAAFSAVRLGEELARAVPVLGRSPQPALHLPLPQLAEHEELRASVVGCLRATVVAPPRVFGPVVWLATEEGWLAVEPADVREGVRWVTVTPAMPDDIGAHVAPLVAAALA